MRSIACSLVLLLAFGAAADARADTYQGFFLNGTLQDGGTLSGMVLVDTTSGLVQSVDATVSDGGYQYLFDSAPAFENPTGGPPVDALYAYFIHTFDDTSTDLSLDLVFPEASLLNYQGGPLCSVSVSCAGVTNVSDFATPTVDSFTTLTATPTPEPPALSMMLAGLAVVGVCVVHSRRDRAWRS